jgi:ABC-type taurine transport system ATPase subunit
MRVLKQVMIMQPGDLFVYQGSFGAGKTQTIVNMCAMFMQSEYARVTVVFHSRVSIQACLQMVKRLEVPNKE